MSNGQYQNRSMSQSCRNKLTEEGKYWKKIMYLRNGRVKSGRRRTHRRLLHRLVGISTDLSVRLPSSLWYSCAPEFEECLRLPSSEGLQQPAPTFCKLWWSVKKKGNLPWGDRSYHLKGRGRQSWSLPHLHQVFSQQSSRCGSNHLE